MCFFIYVPCSAALTLVSIDIALTVYSTRLHVLCTHTQQIYIAGEDMKK